MNRAFSSTVVLSSTVEEINSSENKCQPQHLSGDELKRHLRDIPHFNKSQSTSSLSDSSSKSTNWERLVKKLIKTEFVLAMNQVKLLYFVKISAVKKGITNYFLTISQMISHILMYHSKQCQCLQAKKHHQRRKEFFLMMN